jgi:hypothetical protein
MSSYKCLNAKCKLFNQVRVEKSIIMFLEGNIVDSAESCPICGEPRLCLIEDGMPTAFYGSDNICKH